MEKITYGAPRLVDWVAQIKAGAATVRVHFTGGALTAYGVTPAEYTTDNPFIQKVIEQSTYFKEGRIITLRKATLPETTKTTKAQKVNQQKPKQELQKAPATPDNTVAPTPIETSDVADEQKDEETTETVEETVDGLTKIEASCLQDAQAYLQENFNIASYKVRSYEAAQRAASEHGVQFVGAKFDAKESNEQSENETAETEE